MLIGSQSFTNAFVAFYSLSHQDIDVTHPDFFSNAKQAGYIPPNKEV